jgi:hypothetical protein
MSHASCPGMAVSALETESTRDERSGREGGMRWFTFGSPVELRMMGIMARCERHEGLG